MKASDERRKINRHVAAVIIHSFAVAHAAVALPLGSLAGPILTPMTAGLVFALGLQCSANFTKKKAAGLLAHYGGLLAGVSIAEFILGLLPFIGSGANAIATFVVTEAVGWLTFVMLRDNIDAKGELSFWDKVQLFNTAYKERQESKEDTAKLEVALERMSLSEKETYNANIEILTGEDADQSQRREAQIKLQQLLKPYGIKF